MQATEHTAATDVLTLSDISVRFGGIAALDGVSVSIPGGQLCGLIGANGAGKTTLFDIISGLRTPAGGSVLMNGRDITRWSPHRRARAGMRRTFQRAQVFGWLTIEENLLVAAEWRGGGGGVVADLVSSPTRRRREHERREQARDVLERCGLGSIRDRPAAGVPIGTARLIELGRALVDRPSVLLLDEPTSGLDSSDASRFGDLVAASVDDGDTAVLLVEHDVAFVMYRCHRLVPLHLGPVTADGTPEQVRENALVLDAYLETYTT